MVVGWLLHGTQPGARNWIGGLTGVNVRLILGLGSEVCLERILRVMLGLGWGGGLTKHEFSL